MKRFVIMLTVICYMCFGCTNMEKNRDSTPLAEYTIGTSVYGEETAPIRISYPILESDSKNAEMLNALIQQQLKQQLNKISENDFSNLNLQIDFDTTVNNNDLACFLFEGQMYRKGAAHPVNIAFSVCISWKEAKSMDVKSFITIDNDFAELFLAQIQMQPANNQFSEEDWTQIVAYIEGLDILPILQSAESSYALTEDGVVVLFPVPHAIGDYIKIPIPYSWADKMGDDKTAAGLREP